MNDSLKPFDPGLMDQLNRLEGSMGTPYGHSLKDSLGIQYGDHLKVQFGSRLGWQLGSRLQQELLNQLESC